MKISVFIYPNRSKKNKKTGKIPLYLRVIKDRKKTESRLVIELDEEEMSKWDPVTMRVRERNSSVNHMLNRLDQKYQDFLFIHITETPRRAGHQCRYKGSPFAL